MDTSLNTSLNILADAAVLALAQERLHELGVPRDTETDWETFKGDISGRSEKTIFSGNHRPEPRFTTPETVNGYEISCQSPLPLSKAQGFQASSFKSAILCDYDPIGEANIMFEVHRGNGQYSCHTMRMSKLERLISEDKIIIKKII